MNGKKRNVLFSRAASIAAALCAVVFVSLLAVNQARAWYAGPGCNLSHNCEAGGPWRNGGGSLVQGKLWLEESGDYIIPHMDFSVVRYQSTPPGCYQTSEGGYLITGVYNATFTAQDGSGHAISTAANASWFRLLPRFGGGAGSVSFKPVYKYDLKANTVYYVDSSYTRRHICSIASDGPVLGIGLQYTRKAEWGVDAQSYVGNQGRENNATDGIAIGRERTKSGIRPGEYLYFDHEIKNNSNKYINAGDMDINVVHERKGDNPEGPYNLNGSTPLHNVGGGNGDMIFKYYTPKYQVTQDDVGNQICEHIEGKQRGVGEKNEVGEGSSEPACADVPYHYPNDGDPNDGTGVKITTVIDGNGSTIENGKVTFNYKLHNSGPTKSKKLHYKTFYFILTDKDALPSDYEKQVLYDGKSPCETDNVRSGLSRIPQTQQEPNGQKGIVHLNTKTITVHILHHHKDIIGYSTWTDSNGNTHSSPIYSDWKDGYESFQIAERDFWKSSEQRWFNDGAPQAKMDWEKFKEAYGSGPYEVTEWSEYNDMADKAANTSGWACADVNGTKYKAVEADVPSIPADADVYGPASNTVNIDQWWDQPDYLICSYAIIEGPDWSINDGTPTGGPGVASNIECARLGKRPTAQITGSDSYAGSGFYGAKFKEGDNALNASYSQYGLLTYSGPVKYFGSGNYTWPAGNFCKLIYRNVNSVDDSVGGCSSSSADDTYGSGKFKAQLTPSLAPEPKSVSGSISSLTTGTYKTSGTLRIGNGDYPQKGQQVTIILESGNVEIHGDQVGPNEDASYGDPSQIPNLTIILQGKGDDNGNIYVYSGGGGGVQRVAGNYISQYGRLYTCAEAKDVKSGESSDMFGANGTCDKKLKINGSVYSAKQPQLRRVYGAGQNSTSDHNQADAERKSTSAEWFNYGPQVWLSAYLAGNNTPIGYHTDNITSLPVRY